MVLNFEKISLNNISLVAAGSRIGLILMILLFSHPFFAQNGDSTSPSKLKGEIVEVDYKEQDTLLSANLDEVYISSPREFKDMDEYIRYMKYKRYAAKVYPYAAKAIKIFREVEYVTLKMNKRKRKKHIKRLHKQLKKDFSEPIKKLSKTQGKILIKMIEKELDATFYDLLKSLRGGFTATYWNTLSRMYGYRLKEGYQPGADKLLDAVLQDLDISYKLKAN